MSNSLKNIIRFMEDGHDYWKPLGIVDIEKTGEKLNGYGETETCRCIGEKHPHLYLKTSADEIMDGTRPIKYYYVVQWSSGSEDSYSGILLIPYGKKFLKIEYSC